MQEIFEKYPKAAEKAVEYYTEVFKKSIEESDVDQEYKEYARQAVNIDAEYVSKMIELNPRGAFDFFDDNDLHIGIIPIYDGRLILCEYCINETLLGKEPTRKEAEVKAVESAFENLNERL